MEYNLKLTNGEHIFYHFEQIDHYIENAVSFIVIGIKQGDHIIFIENESISVRIFNKVRLVLTDEELSNVHYTDNFAFYCQHGDFHTPTIVAHFYEMLKPFLDENFNIRTWAHVEWRRQLEIEQKIKQFEEIANKSVNEMGLLSVCAYDTATLSASIMQNLMKSHEFIMTDTELQPSAYYIRTIIV
ncbi:MEDS domain-containing protein [Bacillus sp. M6-12]|uniref:MEDS domain-containing protein n=1 Tax=Bacillus sp. M6-12 TaxID=2054166 RepID=UPI0015E1110D|nr:MEDS domain-containing protein [Bacillus sp. M6-12]